MKQLHYRVRFVTPAFLGNAEQDGQWRTPPFKALLRQWWRVAFAADLGGVASIAHLRAAEGDLFGVAADGDGDSRKSRIRIRLSRWDKGNLKSWAGQDSERVTHPEVKTRDSILHTYFVDSGMLRIMRNRGRRVGNFIGNEVRSLIR